jgi:hypothetical protein
MATEKSTKIDKIYQCKICDVTTRKKADFKRHIETTKHRNNVLATNVDNQATQKNDKKHICKNCGKIYNERTGLWRHNKKCQHKKYDDNYEGDDWTLVNNNDNNKNAFDKEIVMMLLKQNSEIIKETTDLKSMVLEIVKNGTTNNSHNTNNSNNTINNKTFNLQFFLNETCKNAMNIEEFVEQIVLNLNDLEETGRIGFAEGITKMITSRLKALDITERPFHCSDLKRETLYIKNENKWEKEEDDKPKLTKAVKQIACKNIKQIFEWQKAHPDYSDPETRASDKYMKMLTNVMSGGTEEETHQNYDKIIKNITKESIIDKENFLV